MALRKFLKKKKIQLISANFGYSQFVNVRGKMSEVRVLVVLMFMLVVVLVVMCLEELRRRQVLHLLRSEGGLASLEDAGHLLSYSLSTDQTIL